MADIRLHNVNCMDFMKGVPDKAYDLAIVDPPYGINASRVGSYGTVKNRFTSYVKKEWDSQVPEQGYFDNLFRICHSVIIWGGNYFNLAPCSNWIIWDKLQPEDCDYGKYELAWNNTGIRGKIFRLSASWNNGGNSSDSVYKKNKARIHPTQKPVALYKWLLSNYTKPGYKILDTHGGSMSIAIAAYDLGFDLDLCELDPDYFIAGQERLDAHIAKYAPASEIPVTKKGEIKLF